MSATTQGNWDPTGRQRTLRNAGTGFLAATGLMAAAMAAGLAGAILLETMLGPGPTIPDRPPAPEEARSPEIPGMANHEKSITLHVLPKDRARLLRTIEWDATRHGGLLLRELSLSTVLLVPEQYLRRLELLEEAARYPGPAPAYTRWANTVPGTPEPRLRGLPNDTRLEVGVRYKLVNHPKTMPLLKTAGAAMAAAAAAMLGCLAAGARARRDRNGWK